MKSKKKEKTLTMLRRLPEGCVYDHMSSPVGRLTLLASSEGLHAILWDEDWLSEEFLGIAKTLKKSSRHKNIVLTKKQLKEYFSGKRKKFDIPLVSDGTEFQKLAWKALTKIPYGKTVSYQQQAISLGDKNKVRAVGSANGRNPHSIIVPCHRVIAKSGALSGFGGGVSVKKYLIEHEQKHF